MSYQSIDALQRALSENVFHYTRDTKKAAGRALGTIVETISFYLLNEWGFYKDIAIERGLQEYGNTGISHNVEFTMHPLLADFQCKINAVPPLSSSKILRQIGLNGIKATHNILLDKNGILRNACIIGNSEDKTMLATVSNITDDIISVDVYQQRNKPYAMFECKRVGVEEGCKKGPQTIEKAKQGAYVANNASSLQKIRNNKGELFGVLYEGDTPIIAPYEELRQDILYGEDTTLLRNFILTVGIVSNHGNWFSANNMNKELRVLAQSYDWLLFLSDQGLSQFVSELLLDPLPEYEAAQDAFHKSYNERKTNNVFTKTKMDFNAHITLMNYFHNNIQKIESWFNVVSPTGKDMAQLKSELNALKNKNWRSMQ